MPPEFQKEVAKKIIHATHKQTHWQIVFQKQTLPNCSRLLVSDISFVNRTVRENARPSAHVGQAMYCSHQPDSEIHIATHSVSGLRMRTRILGYSRMALARSMGPWPGGGGFDAKMQLLNIFTRFQCSFEFPTEAGMQTTECPNHVSTPMNIRCRCQSKQLTEASEN